MSGLGRSVGVVGVGGAQKGCGRVVGGVWSRWVGSGGCFPLF